MYKKEDYDRIIRQHVNPESNKLSNYNAVCAALNSAAMVYGRAFSNSLIDKYELDKRGLKKQ
jgi:hypothetical protein